MKSKLSAQIRLSIIKRYLKGESVTKLAREVGVSKVLLYRWGKRYKEEGNKGLHPQKSGRPRLHKASARQTKKTFYTKLSPSTRLKMVEEVLVQRSRAVDVAAKYEVSRVTLYKWIKRYKKAPEGQKWQAMEAKTRKKPARYLRQTPEKLERTILDLVIDHPEYGIRRLLKIVPKIKGKPVVGHHGIQNVLRRSDLNTYALRFAYSQAQKGAIAPKTRFAFIWDRLKLVWDQFIPSFAPAPPPEKRQRFFSVFKAFSASGILSFLLGYGLITWIRLLSNQPFTSVVGLVFASIALLMGSLFFLYSLKYYITLAIVLSFSQQDPNPAVAGRGKRGFVSWLLGITSGKVTQEKEAEKPIGLTPNLEHVTLKRYPVVSVHIPLYNEEKVVERILKAATAFEYPNYEVILADDSTDETTQIIENYLRKVKGQRSKVKGDDYTLTEVEVRPGVVLKHLHRTSRSGYKGGALKKALELTDPKAEFVSVFDADFVPYPDTLELFLKYFQATAGTLDFNKSRMANDQWSMAKGRNINHQPLTIKHQIAAVQGYQWHVLNKSENWITRGVRSEYAGSYVIERSGTEIYSGLKQISGAVYMIRRDVLEEVGWETSITEDFELTLKLYEKGYKVVYTPYIQAPAECVGTLRRLIRQRMRWAEGHSNNIKRMFISLMFSRNLTTAEKLEVLYLSPYYLQAFFFLAGTISWLISETLFPARLPFWTSLWGWSLVLTNLISLPLMNAVGLFLEESEERDYAGIASFIALTYIIVPFQAYAALKGFLESKEGPWFRTPKTGRITDVFSRGRFYRFVSGILPGRTQPAVAQIRANQLPIRIHSRYLALASANNQFNSFKIRRRHTRWVGNLGLASVSILSIALLVAAPFIPLISASVSASPNGFKSVKDATPSSEYTVSQEEITGPRNITYPAGSENLEYIFHPEPRVRVKLGHKEIEMTVVGSEGLGHPSPSIAYKEGIIYTYKDIFDGVDLRYTAQNGKLQEHFVLSEYRDFDSIEERIRLNDLVMAKIDGEIQFAPEEGGHPEYKFPRPYIYEEENPDEKNYGIEYEIEKIQFGYKLKKVLTQEGKAWLADSSRDYPVVIDPTLVKSTVFTGINNLESREGSSQRKIAFSAGANGGAHWYVLAADSNDVQIKRCLQSDLCDADSDWSVLQDIDSDGGSDHGVGSFYRESDSRLWVAWIDDKGANPDDTLHFRYIDTTTTFPHTLGTECESADQGTLDNTTNMAYIAVSGNGDIVVGYTDTAGDAEADVFEVPTGTCTFTSIESGSALPTGSQSFVVVPTVIGNNVFLIYNDDGGTNDIRVDVRDTGTNAWDSTDTDIDGSQNYNVMEFSATSDGTDIWLLVLPGATTAPDFFRCGSCSDTSPSFTDESNDPFGTPTGAEDVAITYLSTPNEIKAFILRDSTNQVYANTTDADTISWGTEFSLGYSDSAGDLLNLSSIYSTDDADDAGTVVLFVTEADYEFSTVPENLIYLLFFAPLVVVWGRKLALRKGDAGGYR